MKKRRGKTSEPHWSNSSFVNRRLNLKIFRKILESGFDLNIMRTLIIAVVHRLFPFFRSDSPPPSIIIPLFPKMGSKSKKGKISVSPLMMFPLNTAAAGVEDHSTGLDKKCKISKIISKRHWFSSGILEKP